MADYILSCCSTADLTKAEFEKRDIHYVCFHYYLDDVEHADDLYETMDADTFYQKMADGAMTRTSQVNVEEFIDYFTPFLEEGKDILHLTLSSGISGVYNSACTARDFLLEKYPERKIIILDSLGASSGYGLLMDTLADKRDEGMSLTELADWAETNKLRLHHWFFSTDLTFYVAEHGQPRPADPPLQDPRQEGRHPGDREQDGRTRRRRQRLYRQGVPVHVCL